MNRRFLIEWQDFDTSLECELLDDENPQVCEALWQGMPFQTLMAASMSAGEMLKVPVPVMLPIPADAKRVLFPEQAPGTLLALGLSTMLFKYGVVAEPFQLPRVAVVTAKDLQKFHMIVAKLREAYFFTKAINKATFTRMG